MKPEKITISDYVVGTDGEKPDKYSGDYDTKYKAVDDINHKLLGKDFVIYKRTIEFKPVKTINKKNPRPCYGGWGQGHRISQEDRENETKNPFCVDCKYKLKRVGYEGNLRLVTPHEQQKKVEALSN